MWKCDYCGSLNSGLEFYCCRCGAPKHIHSYEENKGTDDIIFVSGTYKAQNPFQVIMPSGSSKCQDFLEYVDEMESLKDEYDNIIPYWKQYDAIRNFDSKYNTIEKHKPSNSSKYLNLVDYIKKILGENHG